MQTATPFYREAGAGPGVVCLHANASSSSQWRRLMELLSPKWHVLAPDSFGAGKGPPWPTESNVTLGDEAGMLAPVLARAGDPFVLVGHSYGAAVALVAALRAPRRVRALAIFEPTLFSLIDADVEPPNEADGIREVAAHCGKALAAGNANAAAECFVDYWMGAGTWAFMPASRRAQILSAIVNVQGWANALLGEPTPLAHFRRLDMPVLYMTGGKSPCSSLAVAQLLAPVLPRVQCIVFEGVGHMGPITHAEQVNAAIATFLDSIG